MKVLQQSLFWKAVKLPKINTKTIYQETNILSVNQINAQIKLTEVWKAPNDKLYPIKWTKRNDVIQRPGLKSFNKPDLLVNGKSCSQSDAFINDAAKLWNDAPSVIKSCMTLHQAKKQIKIYIKTLPI